VPGEFAVLKDWSVVDHPHKESGVWLFAVSALQAHGVKCLSLLPAQLQKILGHELVEPGRTANPERI